MLDAVLFDMDGTLCDTVASLVSCVNHTFSQHGFPLCDEDDVLAVIGAGERDFFRGTLARRADRMPDDAHFEEMFSEYVAYCKKHSCDLTVPYAGITETIDTLREAGYRLGIVTNKATPLAEEIAEALFPGRFSAIVGAGQYPPKPDPAPALAAAEMLGVRPSRCIFIGDSEYDMMTAVNAGMIPLGVSWGYRPTNILKRAGAKAVSESPDSLVSLIDAFRKGLIL